MTYRLNIIAISVKYEFARQIFFALYVRTLYVLKIVSNFTGINHGRRVT